MLNRDTMIPLVHLLGFFFQRFDSTITYRILLVSLHESLQYEGESEK